MNDTDFINAVTEQCDKLRRNRIEMEEKAKVAIKFMQLFKKKLLQHIEKHKDEEVIIFKQNDVLQTTCECEMRQYMDNDLINELIGKGYIYMYEASSKDTIILKKNLNNK